MTRRQKALLASGITVAGGVVASVLLIIRQRSPVVARPITVEGAVLRQDSDPRKEQPIIDAEIAAKAGASSADVRTDSSGFFKLTLRPGVLPGQFVAFSFRHPDYLPVDIVDIPGGQIYIIRMTPLVSEDGPKPSTPAVPIGEVRLRYSVKATNTVNVSSAAKAFVVSNIGNIPCEGRTPCSPDGKWKATEGSIDLDAGEGNEFQNVRVSCIAGPCPFTKIEPSKPSHPARKVTVSVLNWSDPATFLVEAEVIRTMRSDMIRELYPVIFGEAMNFTLPAAAQGPSIQADLNGQPIVFPLGPALKLSWANCSLTVGSDGSKAYRCELKAGYRFK
ncbi:MAG TPA: hypothetical protein VN737_07610 [Bryobacteraceae bacterium]|nr:hypothetical protein [Bryobacteraceae bacterium]